MQRHRKKGNGYVHELHQVRALEGRDVSIHWSLPLAKSQLHQKLQESLEQEKLTGEISNSAIVNVWQHSTSQKRKVNYICTSVHALQVVIYLLSLMTRNCFEAINTYFHIVTPREEAANGNEPLKKVRRFYDAVKAKCLELYQPLQQLSVDERMVKSKARTHFRQCIRNKPTKSGFKFWVLADSTGFTSDCSLYCGKQRGNGLAFDVVTDILHAFDHQGYSVYFDIWYTSPALLQALKDKKVSATGTLCTNRRGIPRSVLQLKAALSRKDAPRGTGYDIGDSADVYVCWQLTKERATYLCTNSRTIDSHCAVRPFRECHPSSATLGIQLPEAAKQSLTCDWSASSNSCNVNRHFVRKQRKADSCRMKNTEKRYKSSAR